MRAQPKPIRIGAISPLTGALTYNGTQAQAGIRFAVDIINKAGGIKSMGARRSK
ncbi:ABC transporter substrate-binding protein [Achromobacter sp. GG226]|uniref:ABC transporter substrate-binding protein n=1 Tax=Verticiella alkaliphila TaxID=2779529 RepID=UPI001C0E12E5|nr:ABC transporter substrate-binding protein [Verticiella sp. GG226]MBU4609653.1 ABC transporter substrate-binding protein [Verticiella sp. GG226]